MSKFWKCAILFLLGTTSVLPTLWGTFIFDDGEAIVKNEDVTNPSVGFLIRVFQDDFWGVNLTHPLSHKSFRPLTTLTFRWNYLAWGKDAFRFHLINLLIHGINSILVYFFLLKCLGDRKFGNVAFWASILFSVHPVHVEPLGGLVGRADLLAATVFMSAFVILPKNFNVTSAVAMGIFSIFGSLFKETAIMAAILYILLDVSSKKFVPGRREICNYFVLLSMVGSFMMWRLWYQGGPPVFQPYDNPPAFATTTFSKTTSIIYIWILNIKLLIFPIWLCYDWSMGCVSVIQSPFDLRFFIVLGFLIVTARLAYIALKNKIMRTALCIGAVTFFPASNILVTVGFVLAERNLYLPAAGYSLLASYAFLRRKNNLKFLAFTAAVLYLRSVQRSLQWMDEGLLFKSALLVCPNNAKVHYNLGTHYGEGGDKEMAINSYGNAIQLKPDYYQAMNNLGNLLRSEDKLGEAEGLLRKAVEIKPDFAAAWMNLGIVMSRKNPSEAMQCYFKALEHRKRYPDCEYNLGNLFLDLGDKENALKSWKRAVSLKPTHSQSWINIIILLDQDGRVDEAKDWALKAERILPGDDTVQYLLGNMFGKLSRFQEAEIRFKQAIRIRNESSRSIPAKYYANLGVLYHRWNRTPAARTAYETALKIDPNMESVYKNLHSLNYA